MRIFYFILFIYHASVQILIIVLRAEIVTTFGSKIDKNFHT